MKQIPLVFCFMSGKAKDDYYQVQAYLKFCTKIKEINTSADLSWYRNVSHRCRFVPVSKCLAFIYPVPPVYTHKKYMDIPVH